MKKEKPRRRALLQQDYDALERIYSDAYILVRPDGGGPNKQLALKDLHEKGLKFVPRISIPSES